MELFEEVATVVDALIFGGVELKPELKGVDLLSCLC
jgi:hypothetical protein